MSTTIYVEDAAGGEYALFIGLTGDETIYIPPGEEGLWKAVAERYGYRRQEITFSPGDGGDFPLFALWVEDVNITQTDSAVTAAYTEFTNLDQVYDYSAYRRTQDPKFVLLSSATGTLTSSANIVIDKDAVSIWNYNSATNTITIKATTLAEGVKNKFFAVTGSLTESTGTNITCLFSTTTGKSARVKYDDLVSSQLYLADNLAQEQDFQSNLSGSYAQYIDPGATGNWRWIIERYGFVRQSSVFSLTSGNGGDITTVLSYVVDTNITQTDQAVTSALTIISSLDELVDYDAYWRTTNTGISHKLFTASGGVIDYGLTSIIIDKNAPAVYSYNSVDDVITIKSETLASGASFTMIKGTIISIAEGSKITAVYESEDGPSTSLTFNNLSNSTVLILDNLNDQYFFESNLTGNYTQSLEPGLPGTWNWIVASYGKVRQAASFTPISGGAIIATTNLPVNTLVSESDQAVTSARTELTSLDEIYDYNSYWETTAQGISYSLFSNVGGALSCTADIVFDSTASSVWTYDLASNTLTIKGTVITAGTKNTTLTSDSITFLNNSKLTSIYTTSEGTSVNLRFNGSLNSALQVKDSNGDVYYYGSNLTGPQIVYIPPGSIGGWRWTAERYTFSRQSGIITPEAGGVITINLSWTGDTTAFVADATVVATYDFLNDPQRVNDYEAYWRTTFGGIGNFDTVFRNADSLDFGSLSVVIDPTLSTPYNVQSDTVYLRATNLVANVISTTGTVLLANGAKVTGVISDTTGTSSQLLINNLTGCSVAVFDENYVIYDFQSNITGTYDLSVPSDFIGDWTYVVTKFNRVPVTGTFTLGQSVATIVTYNEKVDARVVDTNMTSVSAYTALNSTQYMYDYFSYWSTLEEGIPWHSVVNWSGTVLNCGAADLILDPNAAEVAHIDEISHVVTIKIDAAQLQGDLITTGLVTRLNGAVTTGLVTDSTGTTAIITFSGFTGTNKLYVEDDLGVQRLFTTVTTDEHVLYLLPSEQTENNWTWAAKKTGYQHAASDFNVDGGGRIPIQVGMAIIEQPDGSNMFTTAGIPDTIIVDWTTSGDGTPRINLGDLQYYIQDIYNAVDVSMSTLDGLRWIANGNSDVRIAILPAGNFIFLTTGWRFRCSVTGSSNASVNGFAISADAKSIDASNGPVSLLSASGALAESKIAELDYIYERIQLLPKLLDIEASTVLAKEATVANISTKVWEHAVRTLQKGVDTLTTWVVANVTVANGTNNFIEINNSGTEPIVNSDYIGKQIKLTDPVTSQVYLTPKVTNVIYGSLSQQVLILQSPITQDTVEDATLSIVNPVDYAAEAFDSLTTSVEALPLLTEIEASTVLAKEATVVAIGSPLQADDYIEPDNTSITAIKTQTDKLVFTDDNLHTVAKLVEDKTGYSLTTTERANIATAVEQAILDDNDGQAIVEAIVGAIGNQNIDEIALVAAIRADIERTGGMLDTLPILTEIEDSTVLAKESTVTALPLLSEIEGSTVLAKEATVTELPTLEDIEASTVLAMKTDIEAVPTLAEIEASTILAKEATVVEIGTPLQADDYVAPDNTSIAAIKTQTDNLVFTDGNLNAIAKVIEDKTGYSLTTTDKESIASIVEQSILDEDDGNAIIAAIVAAINNQNIDQASLVSAIRDDLERTGGLLKALPALADIEASTVLAKETTVGELPTLTEIEASTILAKQDSLGDLPTLADIEASTVLAKESTLSSLPLLSDIEGSTILAKADDVQNLPSLADIEASTVLAKQETVSLLPTLTAIEASTVLAKEESLTGLPTLDDIEASTVLAKQTSMDNIPTLADIEASTVLAKEASLAGLPTLDDIEASTVLATKTQIEGLPTITDIENSTVLAKEETVQAAFIAASNAPFI